MPMDVCQGENFSQEPKKQENKKNTQKKNEQLMLFGMTQLQKPRENQKKKVSTHGEGLRGSWTGDMV